MATRIKCDRCDRMILELTANANHGLCGQCIKDEQRRVFAETVEGWIRNPETLPGTNGIPEPDDIALAIRAAQLRSARTPEGQMELACHAFFATAHEKWSERGAKALSEKEKHVLAVETFYGEVLNGGLLQYLGNESHAFANWAADGFDRIGIPEYAAVMREVGTLFPNGHIPEDGEECWHIVEGLDEEALEEIEDGFWSRFNTVDENEIRRKLYAYITDRKSNTA
jgi:hypothetical protein